MGLRDIESSLPPGFRFFPSDEELVCHYLFRKLTNQRIMSEGTMVEVDLHTREPWELPDEAKLNANEWYFFSFRDRKYATGSRTNRATKSGYWKATGKDRTICDPRTQAVVGMRKTLVFYRGRAPNGTKTCWVMHEFRLETPHSPPKEDWVLCRVFNKRKGDGAEQEDAGSSSPSLADLPAMPPEYACVLHEQLSSSLISGSAAPLLREDSGSSFNNSNQYLTNDMATLLQCGRLDYFPQQDTPAAALETSSIRYDGHGELGFLLDLGFDERGVLGDAGMPKWQE